jgi:hypothetical protein
MKNVSKTTRASKKGREIICPHCSKSETVYRFNWKSAFCSQCKTWVKKYEFLIDDNLQEKAIGIRRQLAKYLKIHMIKKLINRMPNKSIIERVQYSLMKINDFQIVNNFEGAIEKLQLQNYIKPDINNAAIMLLIREVYELFELTNIPELRKQKLSKIKRNTT